MNNGGCYPISGRWLCYKNLRETNTNNGILTTDIDDICACLEDNSNSDHPLADSISDELWSMFIAYREDIEELESFKKSAYL